MSVRPQLAALTGQWKGSYRLHTSRPAEQAHDSATTAGIELRVNEQFLSIEYNWRHEGKPQEGVIILGCDESSDAVQAVWTDSWHMSHKFVVCDGTIDDSGFVDVRGTYSAPDNTEWGWRIELISGSDQFKINMFNVSPDGEEKIAVESGYSRE